jgi:hypothetical protein
MIPTNVNYPKMTDLINYGFAAATLQSYKR